MPQLLFSPRSRAYVHTEVNKQKFISELWHFGEHRFTPLIESESDTVCRLFAFITYIFENDTHSPPRPVCPRCASHSWRLCDFATLCLCVSGAYAIKDGLKINGARQQPTVQGVFFVGRARRDNKNERCSMWPIV